VNPAARQTATACRRACARGGAARGPSQHIGVIKDSGRATSIGLVAGTAPAQWSARCTIGNERLRAEQLALTMDEASISDWQSVRTRGFLQGIALQKYLNTT